MNAFGFAARIAALGLAAALAFPVMAQTGGAGGTAESSNPAPAAAAAQVAPGTIEIVPPKGPVGEEVRIIGSGLAPNAPVVVMGGTDPANLTPLVGEAEAAGRQAGSTAPEHVDTSGAFRSLVTVPDDVEYGTDFFLALKIGDQLTQPMPYRVEAREPQN